MALPGEESSMIQERKCLQCGLIKNLNQFGRERCVCVKCEKPRSDSLKYWGYKYGYVPDSRSISPDA
ncbi:MAG: hypothetical protein ACREHG_08420 [Candidatus Saccharimonadales bacterium]